MIREAIRPLTDSERRCLEERLNAPCPVSRGHAVKWALIWLGGLILLAVMAAGLIVLGPNPILGAIVGGILFVAGIICLYALIMVVSGFFHWRNVYGNFAKHTAPVIRQVLAEGRCLSQDVTASEVYEIEEFEDEGPGYIFAIGNGKCLLLKGQQYFPEEDGMPWPAQEFSLVRSADKNLRIGLFSSGIEMAPTRTVKMEDCTDEFVWSEREDVLEGEPEDILKEILRSGQQGVGGQPATRCESEIEP